MKSKTLHKQPKVAKKPSVVISNSKNDSNENDSSEISPKDSAELLQDIQNRYQSLNERCLIVYRAAIKGYNFYKDKIKGIVCAKSVNNKHKASVGHVFLKFDNTQNAKDAIKFFENTSIVAQLCSDKQTNEKSKKWRLPSGVTLKDFHAKQLYVDCIPPHIDRQKIQSLFPKSCAINYPVSESGINNGHAFIEFRSRRDAIEAFLGHKSTELVDSHDIVSTINVNFMIKKNSPGSRRVKKSTGALSQTLKERDIDNFFKKAQSKAMKLMQESITGSKAEPITEKPVGRKRQLEIEEEASNAKKVDAKSPLSRKSLKRKPDSDDEDASMNTTTDSIKSNPKLKKKFKK